MNSAMTSSDFRILDNGFYTSDRNYMVNLLSIFCEHRDFVVKPVFLSGFGISGRGHLPLRVIIGSELAFGKEMYGERKLATFERALQYNFFESHKGSA